MDALKKFLGKKKTDTKFKQAGPGHRLTDTTSNYTAQTTGGTGKTPPKGSSSRGPVQTSAAAAAALARLEKTKSSSGNANELLANRQLRFIKEQAKKEIEAERKAKEAGANNESSPSSSGKEATPHSNTDYTMLASGGGAVDPESYAVTGVYFTCPLIGPEVGTKQDIEEKIYDFLINQPREELGVTSCLLIYSCNKGKEKIRACVETLCKYLDNIVKDPTEVKFQRIRCNNKVFQEKVASVVGANEFLEAAGFTKQLVKISDDSDEKEDFWIYSPDRENPEDPAPLIELRDTLKATTPIRPELDRNLQVLMPAQVTQRRELPAEFYELSGEELRREQSRRTKIAELELTLRTKAQRERDEAREQRVYRYAVMRIRFPDGITLQGTFYAGEKVQDLYTFVRENLGIEGIEFSLKRAGGQILSNMDETLAESHLPPASIVNFKVKKAADPSMITPETSYLNAEILALVRSMEEM